MRAMLDKGIDLAEGAFVEQDIDPFPGGQTSFFVLGFDPVWSTAQAGFRLLFTQMVNVLVVAHVPHFLRESLLYFD